jgi:hypothetical protein
VSAPLTHAILLLGAITDEQRSTVRALLEGARIVAAGAAALSSPEAVRADVVRIVLRRVAEDIDAALDGQPVAESTARMVAAAMAHAGLDARAVPAEEYAHAHRKATGRDPWWHGDEWTDAKILRLRVTP